MANIILPLVTAVLFTGTTVDINSFDEATSYEATIFNKTDMVEAPLDVLNATYYVLQDEKLPYSAMGLPVDMAIHLKNMNGIKSGVLKNLNFRGYDRVAVLFVAEYQKYERSLDRNAVPQPDWQTKLPKRHTHYVDKAYFGSKFVALAEFTSNVTGDIQVMRKKLTEILGVSGKITKETHNLWGNALDAIRQDPELRGTLELNRFETSASGVNLPTSAHSFNGFLKYLPDLSNYTIVAPQTKKRFIPMAVSLKPLHELDEKYPAMEKNTETEKYLQEADDLWEDLYYAIEKSKSIMDRLEYEDMDAYDDIYSKMMKLKRGFQDLKFRSENVFQKINTSAYDAAFEKYHKGLDKGTDNYYIALLKSYEDKSLKCSNDFLKPTKGILRVQAKEIYKKGFIQGGLEECQQECLADDRCKAVGYMNVTETPLFGGIRQLCWIYYRSTVTAKIGVPIQPFKGMTIHDRNCKFNV